MRGGKWEGVLSVTRGYVYVARDVAGTVLYVGMTTKPKARCAQHSRSSAWWSVRANLQVARCETPSRARAVEDDLICAYDPAFNIRGGHGLGREGCRGRRCMRLRAEAERREILRRYYRLRQARRR